MTYIGSGGRFIRPRVQSDSARAANATVAGGLTLGGTAGQQQPQPQQTSGYDISSDPIWQKIQAMDAANVAQAKAQALSAEKQLALGFGDATGIVDDANVAKEAANNPYSILAQLRSQYGNTVRGHDEQLNKANLFYSGTRTKTLANDANGFQQGNYNARQTVMGRLSQVQQALLGAEQQAQTNDIQGLQDAYARASQNAAAYGIDPGASAAPTAGGSNTGQTSPMIDALRNRAGSQGLIYGQQARRKPVTPMTYKG